MSVRWTSATQPSHPAIAPHSSEGITALAAAYALLREIARRPPPPDVETAQGTEEHRPEDGTAEEIAA